jgi:L-iditol 2-dehydrogenase
MMKTYRLHDRYNLQLHHEPAPELSGEEVLVHVHSVGICGSDLLWYSTAGIGDTQITKPIIPCHEFMGMTASGQRVAVDPAIPCGRCDHCLHGNPNLCPKVIFAGHDGKDGALCEQIAWPSSCLFPIPDSITDAEGAMLEPLGVALHAMDLAHLKIGQTVGVFGCGPIGLLLIQLAHLAGASRIIATDPLTHRLQAATALGVDGVFQVQDATDIAQVNSLTKNMDVDVAFDVSGTPDAVHTAFQVAKPGGKVILVGMPIQDQTVFPASVSRRKGLTIKLVRRMKHTYPRAIDLVMRHQVDVLSLVTHHFPFQSAPQAFELAARREGIKIVIDL